MVNDHPGELNDIALAGTHACTTKIFNSNPLISISCLFKK